MLLSKILREALWWLFFSVFQKTYSFKLEFKFEKGLWITSQLIIFWRVGVTYKWRSKHFNNNRPYTENVLNWEFMNCFHLKTIHFSQTQTLSKISWKLLKSYFLKKSFGAENIHDKNSQCFHILKKTWSTKFH